MIKSITLTTIAVLFLVGCGGGDGDKIVAQATTTTTSNGKYSLWEYMTPSSSNTNIFKLSTNSVDSTYKSTYSVTKNRVTEIADYAQDETTIYEKGSNSITVKFEKGGKSNGTYALKLTANINEMVTTRKSDCKLTNHLNTFSIAGEEFNDVIEITCGNIPGYYQKGVGEVAQKEDSSGKNIRVLSN